MHTRRTAFGVSSLALSLFASACSQPVDGSPEATAVGAALYAPETTLFSLGVDDTGVFDEAGRHHVVMAGSTIRLPGGDPGPEGYPVVRFEGGWLEVTNALPGSAADFELAPGENVTLSFYFKTDGYDVHLADMPFFADRMHAIGFGGEFTNFDVDLGDHDPLTQGGEDTTALWTFWNGGGIPNVIDSTNRAPRHYYDDLWHHYEFERRGSMVIVRVDGNELGSSEESLPVGSSEPGMPNWIGRESVAVGKIMSEMIGLWPDAAFPWMGSIAGVRLYTTDAVEPMTPDPTEPPAEYPTSCRPHGLPWSQGNLTVSIDPTNSGMDPQLVMQTIQDAIAQYDAASSFFSFSIVTGTADIDVRFGGNELYDVYGFAPEAERVLGAPGNAMGWGGTLVWEPYMMPKVVTQGVAFLDSAETWTVDLLTKLTLHEFGHAIALDHCDVEGSVMHPTNAQALTLDATTLQALHAVYP